MNSYQFPFPIVTYLVELNKLILTTDLPLRHFCWQGDENAEKAIYPQLSMSVMATACENETANEGKKSMWACQWEFKILHSLSAQY